MSFVDQEIFLFGPKRAIRTFTFGIDPKKTGQAANLLRQGIHGTKQWSFLVQSLPVIADIKCGDAKSGGSGAFFNKGGRSWVPTRITAGFESCTQTTGRKRRSIRLTLNKFFT